MKDQDKTKEQLANELVEMRQRVAELQASETQRKRAEEALTESEERLRTIFETVNDIIAYIDKHGKILNINKRVEDLLGYTRAEIVGKNFTELVVLGPEDLPRIVELFRDTTGKGQVVGIIELELRHKNGQRALMEASTRFIKKNDQVEGIVSVFRDITQRKRAEEALTESEERFRTIFETVNDIIAYIDKHGKILNINKRLEDILGYTRDEIVGKNFTELVALGPADLPRIVELFRDTTREGQAVGIIELKLRHKNGQLALVEVSTRFTKKNGQVEGVVSIFRDITERKRAEQALRKAHDELERRVEERTAELSEANVLLKREITEREQVQEELKRSNEELVALNAIAATIGQSLNLGYILNATLDKVLEMLGIDAGWIQLLDEDKKDKKDGGSLSLVTHRGLSQEMVKVARTIKLGGCMPGQVAQSGRPLVLDKVSDDVLFNAEADTRERLHAFAGIPIESKDKVLGVLGVFSHFPRRLSSREVQLLTAIGHQIGVAVENARLAEEAAEIEILQELNRLRSKLIANVSHELRTPLGLIKVFCATLLREDVDFDRETRREFLCNIDEEADKLEKIVYNLLDLSQMDSGRLRLDKRPADLGQLAGKVIRSMEAQLTQHRLVHDFPAEPLVTTVDAKRIEQVLRNLLSNAIKYSPEGGTITVQGGSDKKQLFMLVNDQGIGIPSEDLERVFDRFYRVENEITQSTRGVGLGLAVCRGIVAAHGGRIWAESTLNEGSAFCFTLPR